ncbi:MAG TPA: hypothetical protein VGB59_06490 [Allosphingosinicella sp.]|jgi:type II secretory pathway component PulJ
MTQSQMYELSLAILAVLLIGAAVAIVLVRTSSARRHRRHKRIAAARRGEATRYDLFAPREQGAEPVLPAERKRKSRRSSSPHKTIDILAKSAPEGETPKE